MKKKPTTPARKRLQLYVDVDVYEILLDRFAKMPRANLIAPSLQKMIGAAILGLQDLPDKKLLAYLQELQARDKRVKR
jgi:hypothetical protein